MIGWFLNLFSKKKRTETRKPLLNSEPAKVFTLPRRQAGYYDQSSPRESNNRVLSQDPYPTAEESPIVLMSDGHIGLNTGLGLSVDLQDGDIGVNIGSGFSVNTGSELDDMPTGDTLIDNSDDCLPDTTSVSDYDSGSSYDSSSDSTSSGSDDYGSATNDY